MKYASYIILLGGVLFLECKKKQDNIPSEIKGINFDLLLKTVDIYTDRKSTTTYAYNNSKQLIQENSLRDFTDGTKWDVSNKWYRCFFLSYAYYFHSCLAKPCCQPGKVTVGRHNAKSVNLVRI